MDLRVFNSPDETAKAAAAEVGRLLADNPIAVLGLSAGHQFEPFYAELIRYHTEEGVSMHKFRSFQVNEYLGLPGTHPMSHRFFLVENFFDHIPVPRRYQKRLPGLPVNLEATCKKFEQKIKSVDGMDLIILTIGRKGQLGFNEAGSSFGSRTRQVFLSEDLRAEYARDFPRGAVPRRGITMGLATIMAARRVILLVTEPDRGDALKKLLGKGKPSTQFPASVLKNHPSVTIYADKKTAR